MPPSYDAAMNTVQGAPVARRFEGQVVVVQGSQTIAHLDEGEGPLFVLGIIVRAAAPGIARSAWRRL